MENLYQNLLFAHIICGGVALVMGLLVIFLKKSGKLHTRLGSIYFWAMTGVFVTSVILALLKFNPFLLGVGVFSYYLVFTGFRFAQMKGYKNFNQVDKWAFIITLVSSIAMLLFSAYIYMTYQSTLIIVLAIFGGLSLRQSIQDLYRMGKKMDKHNWLIEHIVRMLSGYTATVTAFLITAMHQALPPLVLWLGPGAIGGIGITLTVNHYRKKFGIKKRNVVIDQH
ncbi:MAG: putative membrane protein [Maribacter sp.]|jgi:uncharacterized membrane protein